MKKTIIDLFENSVKQYPDNPFLWEKTRDAFEPTTYKEVQQQVYAAGAGLIALGVKKGDNMALLSEGRNAWIIGELAMFYAGATNVPLSIKLEEANDLLFRLVHADVKYILVSGNQLKKIRAIMDKLPLVEKIIVIDELPEYKEKEISWSEVFRMGKEYLASHSLEDFLAVGQSLQNNDYATITYTSGTTADPKGVILTHGERGASPILCRYRRYMAHINNPPTRPLFRACGRFLYLHVERSIRSNSTSRTDRAGNIKEHSGQHQRVQALLDPERPGTGQEFQKEYRTRYPCPGQEYNPFVRLCPQSSLHL